MTITALLTFDLDNTLWDVDRVIVQADQVMRDWLDAHCPAWRQVGPEGMKACRRTVAATRPDIAHDLTALRLEIIRQTLLQAGLDPAAAERGAAGAFAAFHSERNRVTLFDGVAPALAALSARYPLFALSNGNADIHQAGVGAYFREHLSAASVGYAKPHPRMFEQALTLAEVAPGQAIHIGDHPEQDVAAAQAVGMRTIWVNYAGSVWPLPTMPDGEIRHFSELPDLIARLSGLPPR